MNDCDIHYRQSSNKRLLVELTLIQIGQITQPEDQDVPSAGRTPHRLKSLFQKIVAQLKPAAQGAGAGQESGSNTSGNEAKSVAAAVAVPSANESSTASDATKPVNEGAKPTRKSLSEVKLSGIGMSFANLKKTEEAAKRIYNPIDQLKDEPTTPQSGETHNDQVFNQEQVEGQWMSMCLRMQNVKEFIGLANRMKPIIPKITQFPNIEVVADNQLLLNDIIKIKGRILKTFKMGLQNQSVNIDYRLAKADEVTKILSKREVLDKMMKDNPAVAKLAQALKLVMA